MTVYNWRFSPDAFAWGGSFLGSTSVEAASVSIQQENSYYAIRAHTTEGGKLRSQTENNESCTQLMKYKIYTVI